MAKALNLQIVAEGIEHKEQAEFIRDKGCSSLRVGCIVNPSPKKKSYYCCIYQHLPNQLIQSKYA
jgi:EAL domain-containing protein (putative c-di-GMP-specific phosphodiesterase class I)